MLNNVHILLLTLTEQVDEHQFTLEEMECQKVLSDLP